VTIHKTRYRSGLPNEGQEQVEVEEVEVEEMVSVEDR